MCVYWAVCKVGVITIADLMWRRVFCFSLRNHATITNESLLSSLLMTMGEVTQANLARARWARRETGSVSGMAVPVLEVKAPNDDAWRPLSKPISRCGPEAHPGGNSYDSTMATFDAEMAAAEWPEAPQDPGAGILSTVLASSSGGDVLDAKAAKKARKAAKAAKLEAKLIEERGSLTSELEELARRIREKPPALRQCFLEKVFLPPHFPAATHPFCAALLCCTSVLVPTFSCAPVCARAAG